MTLLKIDIAKSGSFAEVYDLFKAICNAQSDNYNLCWNIDIYPNADDLKKYIKEKKMYLGSFNNELAAAMVISNGEDEEYENAQWNIAAAPEKICYLHLLGVHPKFQSRHFSKEMMQFLLDHAKDNGFCALRLAVVKGNLPAERLYQKCGFKYISEYSVYYEITGDVTFNLYELDLQ